VNDVPRRSASGSYLRQSHSSGERVLWRPGLVVGDYRLVEQIGKGSMGVVFLAESVTTGGRYAIKTLPESSDDELVARLKREGEAIARVDAHPNVVRVRSLGSAHGQLYMVMDHVPGGDLSTRVKTSGPLPPLEAAEVVRDLARGLAFMHGKGVVHRDLKPANVLFDEEGTPKLADFGLARVAGASQLTKTNELIGTPAYMSPEQALARKDLIGPATDVYALGGVLHHALTGESPFPGTVMVEVLQRVVNEAPRAPGTRRPGIPPELDALCLRALEKDPERRPGAAALADALDAFLAGRSTKRTPVPWALISAAALLVALVSVGLTVFAMRSEPAPPSAEAPPAPPPTKVAPAPGPRGPRRVEWQLAPRDDFRCRLDLDWTLGAMVGSTSLTLAWHVESIDAGSATLRARIEALAAHFAMDPDRVPNDPGFDRKLLAPIDYDSTRSSGDTPYDAAPGRSFTVVLIQATGRVEQVSGVGMIAAAIEDRVNNKASLVRYQVFGLRDDRETQGLLEAVLHVAPEGGATAGSRWKLVRPAADQDRHSALSLMVPLNFESREEGDLVRVEWSGAAGTNQGVHRRLEGHLDFGRARPLRAHVVESLSGQRDAGVVYDWTDLARE
jgi:serine/threonine-protein kinase